MIHAAPFPVGLTVEEGGTTGTNHKQKQPTTPMNRNSSLLTHITAGRRPGAHPHRGPNRRAWKLLAGALALGLAAGCATHKERPVSQRGWIGGQYVLAKKEGLPEMIFAKPGVVNYGDFPASVMRTQQTAVLVKHLGTNTPAYTAGLRDGDLILELDHRPAVQLKEFRRQIEQSRPGTVLPVKVYRDAQMMECNVATGRETYRPGGDFRVVLPTVVHHWDLWPNPGFSVVVLGYQPTRNSPEDLDPKHPGRPVYAEDWNVFAGILDLSVGKRIFSQETAAPERPALVP
jgi:hypothetical protein